MNEIKQNDLFVNVWGCTMRKCDFYQVISVDKSKVYLRTPEFEDNSGGYDGHKWITGLSSGATYKVFKAKVIRGVLKLCDENFKVQHGSWVELKKTEIGKRENVYSD